MLSILTCPFLSLFAEAGLPARAPSCLHPLQLVKENAVGEMWVHSGTAAVPAGSAAFPFRRRGKEKKKKAEMLRHNTFAKGG